MGESLLAHYAARLPALEHRYVVVLGMLQRIPGCELVFVGSQHPGPEVVDYYLSLLRPEMREDVRSRFHVVTLVEQSTRCVAERLVDDAAALAAIRAIRRDRPGLIEPWQVTHHEMQAALALQMPVNGTHPDLRPLAYKSEGRRLFRRAVVIGALSERGLHHDPATGTGVVLHMLSCLAVDGRFGLTAIGRDADEASRLFDATGAAVRHAAGASRGLS